MLDVRRMQVLRAVVTSGSITAAARNLGYTPSAISQQLATLEREAGVTLLERVGRGVRPTPAGTLLAEQVELVSEQLAKAETALSELKEGRTGQLTIWYFATAGAALVPPAVAAVRSEFPGIRFSLRLFEDDPLSSVSSGEVDVAIVVLAQSGADVRNVEFVHLLDDPYRAVLPKGHRLARKRALDLADLADEPWIGAEWPHPGPCRDILLDACGAAGFAPDFAVEAEDYPTAQGFVAAGLGVTLLPELGLESPHPGVVVRPVRRPAPVRSIQAAVSGHASGRPAVRALLDVMRPG
ncbi:DNA-binding transcriptional regulator, LysR family [Amycolatopsis marina]|uniref:DNA-binding transcriptional regulator, LysR family n=1 Tax=Amycolatopsis marina TaxID=490629 RepID=A0A1I1A2G2_9PSEU|nr:LysR family transcriptional regulator [Amycolatopsis marina]SFB32179.1 DNA-binding transcriptional regulator, LysR family [Amycolatopsis marina]